MAEPRPHPDEKLAPREAAQHAPSKPLTTGEVSITSSDRIRLHQSSPRWRTRRTTPAELARSYGVGKSTISRLMP
jgi:hypothetical protein